MKYEWLPSDHGFQAKVGNVTLCVTPDRSRFGKPLRGTKWHAQCSSWCERTSTASRYGRDEYLNLQDSKESAMKLAENIFETA